MAMITGVRYGGDFWPKKMPEKNFFEEHKNKVSIFIQLTSMAGISGKFTRWSWEIFMPPLDRVW